MRMLNRLLAAGLLALGFASSALGQPAPQQQADRVVTAACTAACDILIRTNGSGTVAAAASGSGSGLTFIWQGLSPDGTWVTLPAFSEGTQTSTTANLSANGNWLLAASGYQQVRAHLTVIGGGTETFSLNASAAPRIVTSGASGDNGGSLPAEKTLTGSASSATTLTNWTCVDVGGYGSIVFNFTSVGSGNTVTFQGSQASDCSNAVGVPTAVTGSSSGGFNTFPAGQGAVAVQTGTTYTIPLANGSLRYLRANITTYGSGTVTGAGTLKVASAAPIIQGIFGALQPANSTNSTGSGLVATAAFGNCDDTSPPAVTENQFGPVRMDCATRALSIGGACTQQASIAVTAGSTTQVVALSGSTVIRVCSIVVSMATTGTWTMLSGTGSNCATPLNTVGTMNLIAGNANNIGDGTGIIYRGSSGGELCFTATTGNLNGWVTYSQL